MFSTKKNKSSSNKIMQACIENNSDMVKQLLPNTIYTPRELMIRVIIGYQDNCKLWDILLPLLNIDDATTRFTYNNEIHTLLSLYCDYHSSDLLWKQKLTRLLSIGSSFNQLVDGVHTAFSYLVCSRNEEMITWCLQQGVDPNIGPTLVCASRWILECEYHNNKVVHSRRILIPYENDSVFYKLLHAGTNVNTVIENGMTPLLAACCEGNLLKISCLVEHGADITCVSKEGATVWTWAMRHAYTQWNGEHTYPIYDILVHYLDKQRTMYSELLHEVVVEQTLLSGLSESILTTMVLPCLVQDPSLLPLSSLVP